MSLPIKKASTAFTENKLAPNEPLMNLARELFPICRSITGAGVRESFTIINKELESPLSIYEIPSNTPVYDWVIPKEWQIKDAWIKDSRGNKVVDFKVNNLHLVNYSIPCHEFLNLKCLQKRLHSLPKLPSAVPYITSYYKDNWGFCLSDETRQELQEDTYEVFIDSQLFDGSMTYGEIIIPGETSEEIFISTYLCHPSMANNELSGPIVTAALINKINKKLDKKYTYRIVFVPETIGSLAYLSQHFDEMKKNIIAGFVVTCVGDTLSYSLMPSRKGNTLADRAARVVLSDISPEYTEYSFLKRGSDERQYCAPKVDLPVASLMRSKYGEYPQYHTSLDNLNFISEKGLSESVEMYEKCFNLIEKNEVFEPLIMGEPQLGKRNLYAYAGKKDNEKITPRNLLNFLTYVDGDNDIITICEITKIPVDEILFYIDIALEHGLIAKSLKK